ncbi:adhesive domain-containing protein [Gracilibacillus sp. JCM 18860]|uniref:adhesive domain-containing protein n=1 Tax=Gracilibacillus sp. JCM 18860 TaxID=1306159 RepID=UPI0006D1CF95
MKKNLSVLLIVLMMFSQLSFSNSTIFAENNTNHKEEINIILEKGASLQESIINVSSESIYDSLKISLPNDTRLNVEKTKALTEADMALSYHSDSHTVLLKPETQQPLSIKLVLNDVLEENRIMVEGYTNNELVASEDFTFSVEKEASENSANDSNDSTSKDTSTNNSLEKNGQNTSSNTKNESTDDASSNEPNTKETDNTKLTESNVLNDNIFTPFSGNLNVDIDLSPRNATILSGDTAVYDLNLKFTGSRTEYTDAEIVIDLPITAFTNFNQNVSDLTIDGVVPTYDTSTQQLVYSFDSIDTGRSYERLVKINTENGVSPNGYELTAQATFKANEQLPVSDDAMVSIEASSSASVSKQFLSVEGEGNNIPTPGSKTLWEIKLDIPKKEKGQMFLKEGSQLIIKDLLPHGLSYDSMESGPSPTQNGDELIWQIDAPTIDDQSTTDTSLFSQTLQVWLTVDQGTAGTTQNNQVEAETTYIDDSNSTVSGQHQVEIVDSETANGDIEGTWYVPVHLGPSNGKGGIAPNSNKNPNPIVYDDALLGFSHGIAPPLSESESGDFQGYTTIYRIDPHLTLDKLSTPGGFVYRPNSNYPAGVPLDEEPRFNIVAFVNGEEQLLVENADQGKTYTRIDLGLAESDRVDYIKYDFTYAPSGMLNAGRPNYYFSVEEGYTGEVVNTFNVYGLMQMEILLTIDIIKMIGIQ